MLNGQKLLRKNGEVVAADEALKGGFQLLDLIITELKSRMTCYNLIILVEITAFRLESKSCKGFCLTNKFSTNESTLIYKGSHDF